MLVFLSSVFFCLSSSTSSIEIGTSLLFLPPLIFCSTLLFHFLHTSFPLTFTPSVVVVISTVVFFRYELFSSFQNAAFVE